MYNYIASWLLWVAEHPWTERFMEMRDTVVDWIDEMPISERIRDWCISTINTVVDVLSRAIQTLMWMILKIILGLIWAAIRLSFIGVLMLIGYAMSLNYLDTYPEPIEHPSGNVVFSRDRCFIKGIEYPEYIAWCRAQSPSHQPVAEIINVTNW